MVNRPKEKGTATETLVVRFLRTHGWPHAERRALTGASDQGDISGCPGIVWEVKYAGAGIRMGQWLGETLTESLNANADHAVLIVKPRGVGARNIGRWLAVMTARKFDVLSAAMFQPMFMVAKSEPDTYHKDAVLDELHNFSSFEAVHPVDPSAPVIPVLVRRPPGSKEDPGSWYCITYLEAVTWLLRSAGYGEPLTAGQDLVAEDLRLGHGERLP